MDVRRLGRLLFTVSLAFASLGLPARADDDATALLAKHKAYVGWELGDGSIKTLEKKGAIARRGKDGARVDTYSTHEADIGILYRLDETSVKAGSGFSQGFNGNKFWYASSNGFVVPNVGESRGDILAQRVVFAEATTKLQGTVVRHDTIDGTPVTVVRELLPSKIPLDLFVDPQTGAYKKYVYDPEGASPTKVDIDAYADALGGKKVVSTWHYEDSPNTHYYDTITANQTFPDSALSPPAPTAKWTFATGKSIPLEVTPQAIYVLATFNGVQGRFVLDTGAGAIRAHRRLRRPRERAASASDGVLRTNRQQARLVRQGKGDNVRRRERAGQRTSDHGHLHVGPHRRTPRLRLSRRRHRRF